MKKPIYILGVNAFHGDSSACLLKDGVLVAALEEERIRRAKHWAGMPSEAIKFCLGVAGIGISDVDHIGISRDPNAHLLQKLLFVLKTRPNPRTLIDRLRNRSKVSGFMDQLAEGLGVPVSAIHATLHNIEHHRAHMGSAFLVSPFDRAALLSVDGLGDFVSTMWGVGDGTRMDMQETVYYPHSIGFFYTALTQYLGFWKYGDEYKVMGLSAFGTPRYLPELRKLVRLLPRGRFALNLEYFSHAKEGITMTWNGGEPTIGKMFSDELVKLLGPARAKDEPLEKRHEDLAASIQALYEEVFFYILAELHQRTGCDALCFAGGTAQNSLANGKIFTRSPFKRVYVPPAGYDAGTAVGAAFCVWNETLGNPRSFVMDSPFWGAEYTDAELAAALKKAGLASVRYDDEKLYAVTAQALADGNIVGWFQGRTEWGPRALGNRSILANPCRPDMKEILNVKIKKREPFRPFAPSVLEEAVGDYFEETYPVPFMEKVYVIKPEKRAMLPAVAHADGTGRLQSVSKATNPRYWALIRAFGDITGVPMVLNTSFNENEPIVNRPEEAIDCFLRTKMDVLVLGNYYVERTN
jgi:carbamoyltransferase